METLATVERILALDPIPGADKIEVATIKGWQVVVQKDIYNVGDLCIYIEIDSLIPLTLEGVEFLRDPKKPDATHHRLKTVKLKGQISQGLCLPLNNSNELLSEGDNLTEMLGIIKYEKTIPLTMIGKAKGNFPPFIPKTDEPRIQNVCQQVRKMAEYQSMYVTEKLDGTSFTCYVFDNKFGVCSRNYDLEETEDSVYWRMARKYNLENYMREYAYPIAVQGEIVGPNIQGNKYQLKEPELYIFRVWCIKGGAAFSQEGTENFAKAAQVKSVPVIAQYKSKEIPSITDLIESSKIKSTLNPNVWAEGIVLRTTDHCPYFSCKIINPLFALKYGE